MRPRVFSSLERANSNFKQASLAKQARGEAGNWLGAGEGVFDWEFKAKRKKPNKTMLASRHIIPAVNSNR